MPHPNRSPQLIAEREIGATLCTFGHVMLRGILCGFIFLLVLILAPLRVIADPPHRAMFLQDIPFLVEASRFGGFSALHIAPGGVKFILISDRGAFVTGRFLRDATGSIESIEIGALTPLRDQNSDLLGEGLTDSEGLALAADGSAYVSFEGPAQVRHYASLNGSGKILPSHRDFADLGENLALESLAIAPDGSVYTIPESSSATDAPFPVYRFRDGGWDQPFTIPRRGPFLVSDVTFGPDGRLYLLERSVVIFAGFATRLRRFDLGVAGITNDVTLFETKPGTFGNLEGLTIWRDSKGLRATMAADDNFSDFLRSHIVEYRLPG